MDWPLLVIDPWGVVFGRLRVLVVFKRYSGDLLMPGNILRAGIGLGLHVEALPFG